MIELRTLGTLGLRDTASGRELHSVTAQPKRVALLAYLAIASPRGFHRRDTLLGIFWPDSTEARARAALSQALYTLRRTLGESIVVARGDEDLAIGADELWCDAVAFDELLAAGERAKALELYGGDLLKGFFISECMEFEQWLHGERARLRDRAAGAAWTLADENAAAGNAGEAGHWARRAVSFTPEDEPSVRRLVTLLLGAGDRAGALRELDALKVRMRELELDLTRETVELEQRVRADTRPRSASMPLGVTPAERETPRVAPPAPIPALIVESQPRFGLRWSPPLLALAAGILVIAVIGAIAVTAPMRSAEQPLFSDKRVLVAEFTNETGDTSFAALGRATADWLSQGLSQTGLVEVVPSVTAMRSARAIDEADEAPPAIIARSLAEETGAGIVVSGAYYKEGDTLILHARITEGRSGRVLRGIDPVRGPASDPMAAVDQLRRRTLGALASLTDARLATWSGSASQPPSFEAYQLYAEGLDDFFRLDFEGFTRAAARFRQAADLHPGFTAPLIWATFGYMNLNRFASADSLAQQLSATRESLPAWDRAILAYLEAQIRGSNVAAYTAARRVAELAPQSEWRFLQAQTAFNVNRPNEAVAVYAGMDPDRGWIRAWPAYWTGLATAQHFSGEYRDEVETLKRGRRRHPDQRLFQLFGVRGLAAAGEASEAAALADSIAAAATDPFAALNAHNMLARELRVHGDSAESLKAAERGLAAVRASQSGPMDARRKYVTALLFGYAERWPEVYELTLSLPVPGRNGTNLGLRGIAAARTGRRAEALAAAVELAALELPYVHGAPKLWAAGIHAHMGQRERAVELLRTAIGEGLPYDGRGIHGHLGVLPLRGYRPFEELVRPRR